MTKVMEENKAMKASKAMEVKQPEKLSYEQLKDIANNLQVQLQNKHKEYQQLLVEYNRAMEVVMGKRLDSLFNVLKYKDLFSEDFVSKAVINIETMLTIPEPDSCETCKADKDVE